MSVQPVPPSTGPTTAGQLAARATQNDQFLSAWLDDHEARVAALESGSGTSGSGILNVSGTVNLDDAPGIREVYATASATVEGVALTAGDAAVFRYLAGAWTYMVVGEHTTWQTAPGAPPADTTPPTPGTLTVTGSGDAGTVRTLTVTGASDAGGLHATPYRFSTDGGTTWSTYQASNVFTTAALSAGTYQPRVMVRDAAGNTATASAADFTVTTAAPAGVSYLQTAWSTTQGTTHTFAGQNLGAASATRTIVAVIYGQRTAVATTLTSATIGGVAATIVRQGEPNELTAIVTADVPTGTSGDVVVTADKALVVAGVALYSVPSGLGAVHDTDLTPTAPQAGGEVADNIIDVPANGLLVVGYSGRSGSTPSAMDWVTFPEDDSSFVISGSNSRIIEVGHKTFAAAQTDYTVDIYSPSQSAQMKIAASWPVNP